jgi:quinoprotein glucose dehydrogenase
LEAVRATARLGIVEAVAVLHDLAGKTQTGSAVRAEALKGCAQLKDPELGPLLLAALEDPDTAVRSEGVRLLKQVNVVDRGARLEKLATAGPPAIRRTALTTLGSINGTEADAAFGRLLDKLLAGRWPNDLTLDLLEAAGRRPAPAVRERLTRYAAARPKGDPLAAYRETLEGGDAVAGAKVFNRSDAGCIKCHMVRNNGGVVGPALTAVGTQRTREYLLESLVLPNKEIAQGYDQVVVETKSGLVKVGRVQSETATELFLLTAEGNLEKVSKDDIDTRTKGKSAMPEDLMKVLSMRDVRDLVEYLSSLKGQETKAPK